jgi:hypothetical protein
MSIFVTAGSRLFVGGVKAQQSADFVAADFDGESWVEVSWVENIGQFGDESAEVTFDAIGESRTLKLKGVRNAGNLSLVVGADYSDAGQAALRAAEATPDDYAFRVDFDDAPAGGTPSQRFFIAKVMSAREQLDTANNVIKLNATLGINSNVVRVDAAGP